MSSIRFSFSQCLRHAFMSGAGYRDVEKRITDADQKRWVEYDPPTVGSFKSMYDYFELHQDGEKVDIAPSAKWVVIAYRQYGQWSTTTPFKDLAAAEKHAKFYLASNELRHPDTGAILVKNTNEHIKDITYVTVELPA